MLLSLTGDIIMKICNAFPHYLSIQFWICFVNFFISVNDRYLLPTALALEVMQLPLSASPSVHLLPLYRFKLTDF